MIIAHDASYVYDQLSLFAGGLDSVMVEFTAHLVVGSDQIVVGLVITHSPTLSIIGMEVPTMIGSCSDLPGLALAIAKILEYCHSYVDPF